MSSLGDPLASIQKEYAQASRWIMQRFTSLFDQMADPLILLRHKDIIAHQVSLYCYYPIGKRPAAIGKYVLDPVFGQAEKSCVYVNQAAQHLVLGYRGTDFHNIADVLSDVQILLGVSGVDNRISDSLALYDKVQAVYPAYKKTVCGHSLGGTISYIIAKHRQPERCTVFNPGSAPNAFFIQMLTDTVQKARWVRRVFTYKVLGDVVSTFSFVGTTKLFRIAALDPLALHSLENFMQQGATYVPAAGS